MVKIKKLIAQIVAGVGLGFLLPIHDKDKLNESQKKYDKSALSIDMLQPSIHHQPNFDDLKPSVSTGNNPPKKRVLSLNDLEPSLTSTTNSPIKRLFVGKTKNKKEEKLTANKIAKIKRRELSILPREMNIDELMMEIKNDEGYRTYVYLDPSGDNYCVGIGHNLNKDPNNSQRKLSILNLDYKKIMAGEQSISINQAIRLLEMDLKETEERVKKILPNFYLLPGEVKKIVLNMSFQLGSLSDFPRLVTALKSLDYDSAVKEMRDAIWADQTKNRANRLIRRMDRIASISKANPKG